jgi:signal transduction histidine kinase
MGSTVERRLYRHQLPDWGRGHHEQPFISMRDIRAGRISFWNVSFPGAMEIPARGRGIARGEFMSAILQIWPHDEEPADSTLLSAVMEACRESLAIVESGRVRRANRVFARMFGYFEGSDVEGHPFAKFVPDGLQLFPSDAPADDSNHASIPGPSTHECTGIRRDGSRLPLLLAAAGFCVDQREQLVVSLHQIDERQRDEAQFLESQKLKAMGRAVGGVAHDFNNLLTGILLYCDLLVAGLEPHSPLRNYVEEIRKAGGHSSSLIRQLLAVARPDASGARALSWNEVISGMSNFLRCLLGENIELLTDLAGGAGRVRMDPAHMRQVVLNLLLNARDAMPEGGQITLSSRECAAGGADSGSGEPAGAPYVEFTVADTGAGMEAATRAHLFETFFTTKRPGKGNGLGLATVYRIVKQGNGTISVDSEPGKGTRISVRLPRVSENHDQSKLEYPSELETKPS